MKGAVNIKHLTTNRQRAQNLSWQPALFRLRRTVEAGFAEIRSFITTWCRLQKLKSDAVGDGRRPRFYLSLNGLLPFPVVRRSNPTKTEREISFGVRTPHAGVVRCLCHSAALADSNKSIRINIIILRVISLKSSFEGCGRFD